MASLLDPQTADNSGEQGGDLLGNKTGEGAPAAGVGSTEPQIQEWMKDLPESLQKSPSLAKFKSKDSLAKSYIELEKKHGSSVTVPSRDASPEDWEKFYDRVGRPKTADEYAIDRGKSDDAFVKAFKQAAHEAGLTVEQASKVFGTVTKVTEAQKQAAVEQYTSRMKEADAMLRKEYGPQYDSRLSDARKAYDVLFDETLRSEIAESGLANNPRFIKVLAQLGPQIRGDSFLQGANGAGKQNKEFAGLEWMDKLNGQGT